jgi:hypothetical protein
MTLALLVITAFLLRTDGLTGPAVAPAPLRPGVREQAAAKNTDSPSEGTVLADDETTASPPRQDTGTPPPEYVAPRRTTLSPTATEPEQQPIPETVVINDKTYPRRTYATMMTPNDPLSAQWWVGNARLGQAWDVPRGNNPTLLAIIDTGFALKHEEFTNRWYVNDGESGTATRQNASQRNCTDRGLALSAGCNLIDDDRDGTVDNESGTASYQNPSRLNCSDQNKALNKNCNRVDDDDNGLIDDVQGWDFINSDNSAQAGELHPEGNGTKHGTMVAGVAAATGNNGKGIAGVDWGTKILPIQAIDDDLYGDTLSVGQAILYAARQGADVISLSLGSDQPDEYVQDAVRTAVAAGSVVVAASGNGGCECMVYPANYPEAVAVGSIDANNQRASFSAWGANLDVVAPGTQINTSTFLWYNQTAGYANGVNGTSFSTPMVSGLLTRLLSQRPDALPLQLIAALTESTNRLSLSPAQPLDKFLGYGALDAVKATTRMTTPNTAGLLYTFKGISDGSYLDPAHPDETPGTYEARDCDAGTVPTTPVHQLSKGASRFFSLSNSENTAAQLAGYTSSLFTRLCMRQPHDTATIVRTLEAPSEFRNLPPLK